MRVLLPLPLAGAYDYRVGPGLALKLGEFVRVPLGRRQAIGVVWGGSAGEGVAEAKLRNVSARCDAPPLSAEMRRFIDWVADYTLSPPGAVLRMAMSVPEAIEPPKPTIAYRLAEEAPHPDGSDPGEVRLTTARRRVLRELGSRLPRGVAELALAAGVGAGVVRSLVEIGWLEEVDLPRIRERHLTALGPGRIFRPSKWWRQTRCANAWGRGSLSPCSTASPVPARRKSTSRRSLRRCGRGGRCWCCCRRLR